AIPATCPLQPAVLRCRFTREPVPLPVCMPHSCQNCTAGASGKIEQQNFRATLAADLQAALPADRRAIALLQRLTIEHHAALGDLQPGIATSLQAVRHLTSRPEDGGVEVHALMDGDRTVAPVGRGDET